MKRVRSLLFVLSFSANAWFSQTSRGGQWLLTNFPPLSPVITFEKFGLPVEGLNFDGGVGTGVWMNDAFGQAFYGNISTWAGYTYLGVTFEHPQQAVGAYIIADAPFEGVTAVTESVYDAGSNLLESVTSPPLAYAALFVGIGQPTTNIWRVEWHYVGGGFFGVGQRDLLSGSILNANQHPSDCWSINLQSPNNCRTH